MPSNHSAQNKFKDKKRSSSNRDIHAQWCVPCDRLTSPCLASCVWKSAKETKRW